MCKIIDIVDAVQTVLDYEVGLLNSVDQTEGDFKNKIALLYQIDDRREQLVRVRTHRSSLEIQGVS